jgi:tripartite-type tricarboxylate transporter receptor subunit TctC
MSIGRSSTSVFLAILLGLLVASAAAADYPDREVTLLVGFAPGGSTDTTFRALASSASKLLGHPVVVNNRPGAGGSLALSAAAKAKPDGYTLVNFNISAPIGNVIKATDPFNVLTDFAPVCNLTSFPNIIVVPAASKFRTLADLVQEAKKRPGDVTGTTAGVGTSGHFSLELFKRAAGLNVTHVPHKGSGPAVTALLGGHVDFGNINSVDVIQHIKAGTLRGLAVTSPARLSDVPDLPTIGEAGYADAVIISWIGLAAPAGTPDAVVKKLADTFEKALAQKDVQGKLRDIGFMATYMAPGDFRGFIKKEYDRYKKLAAEGNIKE